MSSISGADLQVKLLHLLFKVDELGRHGNLLFFSQITLVHFPEVLSKQLDEPLHSGIFGEQMEYALDLDAFILPFRIEKKQDFIDTGLPRREVDERSVFTLPDDAELRFEPDMPPLVERPSVPLFATVCGHMLWNDRETFLEWLSRERLVNHITRLPAWNEAPAE